MVYVVYSRILNRERGQPNKSIMKYTAEGKFRNEKQAKTDLATCAYAGKWKAAKAYVCRHQDHVLPYSYWDAVRLHFLELGGE